MRKLRTRRDFGDLSEKQSMEQSEAIRGNILMLSLSKHEDVSSAAAGFASLQALPTPSG
jgi:hypothetical protein